MTDEKNTKVDIPESIDAYKVTLFWGLTIAQVVLVFMAVLCIGFAISGFVAKKYLSGAGMLFLATFCFLGMVEIRGRNFFRYLMFIASYYRTKPRVLIYYHTAASGLASEHAKQLVFDQEDHSRTLFWIIAGIVVGVLLILLTAYFLFHAIHS